MKQIFFFGEKTDLALFLETVERRKSVAYIRMGQFTSPALEIEMSANAIRDLGISSSPSAITGAAFLVAEQGTPIAPRAIRLQTGEERFCVDQLVNPDTIVLRPGGTWREDVLIAGAVGSASDTAVARAIFKEFERAVKTHFEKINGFWVGPAARKLYRQGVRLTEAEQSPREYDLVL